MNTLSSTLLLQLAEPVKAPCVSIFVPVARGSYDERAARLDLKNLVATARTNIREVLRPHETDDLLAPAEEMLMDAANWSDLDHGLAFFLSPDKAVTVRLPETVEPIVMVGDHFDVLPLLPMLQPDFEYHVLALSRNEVKVFHGARHSFEQMHIAGLPKSLDDDLWYEEHSNALVSHGGPRMGSSRQPTSIVHGGESWRDERKEMFERFAQHLEVVLEPVLRGDGPLVLAATERDISAFKDAADHIKVLEHALVGNPEEISETDLHRDTWDMVASELDPGAKDRLIDRFNALAGTHRSSIDATEIYEAASTGRVETLLVPELTSNRPDALPRQAGGVDNFVNTVVLETLRHDGEVEVVPARSLAEGVTAAAIFRWPESATSA
jgi:Bacterial archaeo-eukaryotic release factor family 3